MADDELGGQSVEIERVWKTREQNTQRARALCLSKGLGGQVGQRFYSLSNGERVLVL
jgi:hypothetical protein